MVVVTISSDPVRTLTAWDLGHTLAWASSQPILMSVGNFRISNIWKIARRDIGFLHFSLIN
jgi:hypothetical protein